MSSSPVLDHNPSIDNEHCVVLFEHDHDKRPPSYHQNPTSSTCSSSSCVPFLHNILDISTSPSALHSNTPLDHSGRQIVLEPRSMDSQNVSSSPVGFSDKGKGKGVSMVVPIPLHITTHHTNDMSPISALQQPSPSSSQSPVSYSPHTHIPYIPCNTDPSLLQLDNINLGFMSELQQALVGSGSSVTDDAHLFDTSDTVLRKGKDNEHPPTLPPLSFTELGYGAARWHSPEPISPTAGPSSYGSGNTSFFGTAQSPSIQSVDVPTDRSPNLAEGSPILRRMPSRRHSCSSLSVHSTSSTDAHSMPRAKSRFNGPKYPSGIARKLLSKARTNSISPSPVNTRLNEELIANAYQGNSAVIGQSNCFLPWRNDYKRAPLAPYLSVNTEGTSNTEDGFLYRQTDVINVKGKGRSYSSPQPISVLHIVPVAPDALFVPLPIVLRNYFDEFLPRELQLHVLSFIVPMYEEEHERTRRTESWTAIKTASSRYKWVGKDKGMRELVKLSRVSKAWQTLVFDGQLWMDVNLRAFPKLPTNLLLRLSETPGAFVKKIDLTGHVNLTSSTLLSLTSNLCSGIESLNESPYTQLTDVNLQGCSALTTQSLHNLLIHSPLLRNLCLKGLKAVTNMTCDLLALSTHLTTLNLSRCPNMDAQGILDLASVTIRRGNRLALKELRLSGLRDVSDEVMANLGKAAPYLEVLDLSYSRTLHNSAVEAFISCTEQDTDIETVTLNAREAGRGSKDSGTYRRRVTALRHIVLSSCVLLTDIACSHLAHTVPRLEFLELAGIGFELKDDGLIRLLVTTPLIRKLDLEDAYEITDAVLSAITPINATNSQRPDERKEKPQPGHALEHLIVSYASNLNSEKFKELMRSCTRLRVLEADSTAISGSVLREFVRLGRDRNMVDPKIVAVDCRGIGESIVKEVSSSTRPRQGWRSWEARKLAYLDGRDEEDLKVGQDECDEMRVVLKSFYSWQTVDAVRTARERRHKAAPRRLRNSSLGNSDTEGALPSSGRSGLRWWSPSGRRSSGSNTPGDANDRDGCIIM